VAAGARPFRFGFLATAGGLLIVLVALAVLHTSTVVTTVLAAGFFAVGLNAPAGWLMRRGLSRATASWLLFGVFSLLGCGGVALLAPVLTDQVSSLMAAIPDQVDRLLADDRWNQVSGSRQVNEAIKDALTPANITAALTGLLGGALSIVSGLAMLVTAFILTFFVLAAFDRLRAGAYRMLPRSGRDRLTPLFDEILGKVSAYLVGAIGIATVAGTTALIYMLLTGIPYALLLALVVAFLDTIPQVGATIGACVVVAVSLGQGLGLAIATTVFFIVYQQVENWLIYPRVMNRAVKISNLAAVLAVLVGFSLFGVLGVLIAVPGFAGAQLLVRELYLPRQERR
jgi:predicted PurR-regulated permease PerM